MFCSLHAVVLSCNGAGLGGGGAHFLVIFQSGTCASVDKSDTTSDIAKAAGPFFSFFLFLCRCLRMINRFGAVESTLLTILLRLIRRLSMLVATFFSPLCTSFAHPEGEWRPLPVALLLYAGDGWSATRTTLSPKRYAV